MPPNTAPPRYSVVVPVYNSEQSLIELVERLAAVFDGEIGASHEVILIDDGSENPATWAACERLSRERPGVTAICLMRNYGKPGAVICGLEHSRGQYIITIDDDLQQRPEDIPKLIEHQEHDVVVANFPNRKDSLAWRVTSWIKSHFDRAILGLPCRMSPLKLFTAEVARGVLQVRTPHPFIPALLAHVTRDFVPVAVEHRASRHGESRYTLRGRFRQFSNLLISNSAMLLRCVGALGVVLAAGGFLFALFVIVRRLSGVEILPGWASLVVINLVFGGATLIGLGIVGEYLIRILETTSSRPPYVVRRIVLSNGSEGREESSRS